jgi:ATP-binding cassette subfamily C (CFTR/MRP) protein 1
MTRSMARSFYGCGIESQKGLGPTNDYCYGGFDFTLFFEETVLTIAPFFVFFPFLFIRFYRLCRAPIVVDGYGWHIAKQVRIIDN